MGVRQEQKAETRERILTAARELYLEQEPAATTLDEVARRAGVAKGSIFFHFGSRTDLLAELGLRLFAEGMRELERRAAAPGMDAFLKGAWDVSRLPIAMLQWRIHDELLWERPMIAAANFAALAEEIARRLQQDGARPDAARAIAAVLVPAVLMTGRRVAAGELDDTELAQFDEGVRAIVQRIERRRRN
jgi:AcrR family transcriptional regulator